MNRYGVFPKSLMPGVLALFLLAGVACNDILEVTDPDLVTAEKIQGARGADLLWAGGILEFARAFSGDVTAQTIIREVLSTVPVPGATIGTKR